MSLQRCAPPATAVPSAFLKFNSSSLPRICPLATRTFSCSASLRFSHRRKLMTESAFRSHSFDFPPPLPRNGDVPSSSTAGNATSLADRARDVATATPLVEKTDYSLGAEMSKSSASAAASSDKATGTSTTRPKRKLRARKAAMTLTPAAIEHLKELLELPDPKLIRVGVKNRGCSGLAYNLEYVDKAGTFDEVLEQDGVKVLIDSKALFSIIGSEMDWMEDKLSQRFVFKNPNITEECGCGESFSVG